MIGNFSLNVCVLWWRLYAGNVHAFRTDILIGSTRIYALRTYMCDALKVPTQCKWIPRAVFRVPRLNWHHYQCQMDFNEIFALIHGRNGATNRCARTFTSITLNGRGVMMTEKQMRTHWFRLSLHNHKHIRILICLVRYELNKWLNDQIVRQNIKCTLNKIFRLMCVLYTILTSRQRNKSVHFKWPWAFVL